MNKISIPTLEFSNIPIFQKRRNLKIFLGVLLGIILFTVIGVWWLA